MPFEPGKKLDSLIARKIWRVIVINDTAAGESYMVGEDDHAKVPVPEFSTKIDDAHRIVEYFQNKGWTFRVRHIAEGDFYQACFYRDDGRDYRMVKADNMAMAICVAALSALGVT